MPALPPYLPTRDSNFNDWLQNFSEHITADPFRYGLVAGDAVTIAGQVAAWSAAYTPVLSASTKTREAVVAKNNARVTVTAQIRSYAQRIAINAGVASSDKVALGLNPRTSTPSPVTPPTTNPVLLLQSCSNLSAYLRYRDSAASVSVKSKPYGVVQLQLMGLVSATPITDVKLLQLRQVATRSPLVMTFDSSEVGKQVYVAARWVTRTGGLSPWSPIINFTVVGAG